MQKASCCTILIALGHGLSFVVLNRLLVPPPPAKVWFSSWHLPFPWVVLKYRHCRQSYRRYQGGTMTNEKNLCHFYHLGKSRDVPSDAVFKSLIWPNPYHFSIPIGIKALWVASCFPRRISLYYAAFIRVLFTQNSVKYIRKSYVIFVSFFLSS